MMREKHSSSSSYFICFKFEFDEMKMFSQTCSELRGTKSLGKAIGSLSTGIGKRYQHALAVQLDYYMSPQFAGVAHALMNGTYVDKGLTDITFLPTCPVGLEQARVRLNQNSNPTSVSIGTIEQNIFAPYLKRNPQLKTTAVAAMFDTSPLAVAYLPKEGEDDNKFSPNLIGVHEDTVNLMEKVFPEHDVVASPRCSKNSDLLSGKVGGIQVYTTTEVPTLSRTLSSEPGVIKLEGYNGTKLGYSQLMFVADECLECSDRKEMTKLFCEATFEGWGNVIENPEDGVEAVREAKLMLNLDDENNDHWYPSDDFELEMVQKCNEHVKGTFANGNYGKIDRTRWDEANNWLLDGKSNESFGLDSSVYQ